MPVPSGDMTGGGTGVREGLWEQRVPGPSTGPRTGALGARAEHRPLVEPPSLGWGMSSGGCGHRNQDPGHGAPAPALAAEAHGQRRRAAPRTEEQNETDASGGENCSGMNLPQGAGQVNGKRPPGDKGRDSGCGAVSGDDTAMNNQRKVMGEGLYNRACN